MKKMFFFLLTITLFTGCDCWPSHCFYIQNSIPNSEIVIDFDYVDDSPYAEAEENRNKKYALNYEEKVLVRVIYPYNSGIAKREPNIFDTFENFSEGLSFNLYVNGVKIDKILYTKEFWQFTSHKGNADYLLVITEDLIQE
ncbi:MAG: hypothetical protein LBM20_05875 [Rikenellaceae bacterium]|jgi:hypothetical protein|nr:hypothetical protein [Rikenellaceae bacterium]